MTHRGRTKGWAGAAMLAAVLASAMAPAPADETTPPLKADVGAMPAADASADTPKPKLAAKKGVVPKGLDEAKKAARKAKRAKAKAEANKDKDQDGAKDEPAADPLAGRPPRVVTKPRIDAAQIDAMLEASLAGSKVKPAEPTSDIEFVRRAYLDLVGKLPTPAQVESFMHDRPGSRRDDLIAGLLSSKGFGENWARFWRDVIRSRAPQANAGRVRYDEFETWLAGQLNGGTPWDEIVGRMITSTGRVDEEGAASFILAENADPIELAGEVSRVFMGVQIQCAQCHDHRTDPWKREQFHEFAAFFAGTKARRATKPQEKPAVFEVISQPGVPRYTMPDLAEPTKLIPVKPKFFLASSEQAVPGNLKAHDRRVLAASYVTGQDNPWFARAYVNRVWAILMGEGFCMPVDDMGPGRKMKAGDVLDRLASEWQGGGYDVKWLFRTLMETKAYQRRIRSTASEAGRTTFAANCTSRLRSDQIFDSLAQVLGIDTTSRAFKQAANAEMKGGKGQAKGARLGGDPARALFNVTFGEDPSTPPDEVVGTIPQALVLMNGPMVNKGIAYRKTTAKGGSVLGEILDGSPTPHAALDRLYLRVLARRPTADEAKIFDRYLSQTGGNLPEAFEDLFWALLNSTEFLSRR
ncbi:DUF1549 domain-containing protein [Isosphaeraceae bacterium EP7]